MVSGSSSGPKANDRQSLAATDIQWLIVIGQSVSHVAYSVYMANWQVGDNRTKTALKECLTALTNEWIQDTEWIHG